MSKITLTIEVVNKDEADVILSMYKLMNGGLPGGDEVIRDNISEVGALYAGARNEFVRTSEIGTKSGIDEDFLDELKWELEQLEKDIDIVKDRLLESAKGGTK